MLGARKLEHKLGTRLRLNWHSAGATGCRIYALSRAQTQVKVYLYGTFFVFNLIFSYFWLLQTIIISVNMNNYPWIPTVIFVCCKMESPRTRAPSTGASEGVSASQESLLDTWMGEEWCSRGVDLVTKLKLMLCCQDATHSSRCKGSAAGIEGLLTLPEAPGASNSASEPCGLAMLFF